MEVVQVRQAFTNKLFKESTTSGRSFTTARIGLGRTGTSIPLNELLAFKLAHANARDAVYSILDYKKICSKLRSLQLPFYLVKSKAKCREQYLKQPDLGRHLDIESKKQLSEASANPVDVAIIIADGLSANAVNNHAIPVTKLLIKKFKVTGYSVAPIVIAEQGRVAIADEVGVLLKARLTIILLGERPGLSSCDSLSAYLTYSPKRKLTDEARNCISNIRTEGLGYEDAINKIFYLVQQAFKRKLSGVYLKDEIELLNH